MPAASSKNGLASAPLCGIAGMAIAGSAGISFFTTGPSSSLAERRATAHSTAVGQPQRLAAIAGQDTSALAVGWRSGSLFAAAAAALGTAAVRMRSGGVTWKMNPKKTKVKNDMWPSIKGPAPKLAETFTDRSGITKPMGFWDPLDLSSNMDELEFRRRRIAEVKNGRVAMLACMGYIAPEFFRWSGYLAPSQGLKFTDLPNGIGALYKVPSEAWAQIFVFIGFLELFGMHQDDDRAPGDFKTCGRLGVPWFFIPGGLAKELNTKSDPVKSARSLDAELNNGRLAMVAITGMIFQNLATGSTGASLYGLGQ